MPVPYRTYLSVTDPRERLDGMSCSVNRATRPRWIGVSVVVTIALVALLIEFGLSASAQSATSATNVDHSASTAQSEFPDGATSRGDNSRAGWYPSEPGLTPQVVGSSNFGQLFSTSVNGQVYGQPLLDQGNVLVVTETDYVYGLDPVTGAINWQRQIGTPYDDAPWVDAVPQGCADLTPDVGITSTPTVDPATGIAYIVAASDISGTAGPIGYFMHAIDPPTENEEPGFPVQIQGSPQNNSAMTFNAGDQLQRPGLLLLGGVVYAAFSAHCDQTPYDGWVAGVSTAGTMSTLWTDEPTGGISGGGIWQAGGGLTSERANQILLAAGNGADGTSPSGSIPGSSPPGPLSESVVRLVVQPDGGLEATDFFTPHDAAVLGAHDLDFGSGAPVSLPSQFGTTTFPHLLVQVGKEGYVYLLNRDNLGGVGQGAGGGDGSLARLGPNGGVYATPGVWPGDGGYIYIPATGYGQGALDVYKYGITESGTPTISQVATAAETFAFGSSSPVVTSNGTTSGSALVWVVRRGEGGGTGAQLQAYSPVPVNGTLPLVASFPIGTSTKFNPPGIGNNRLYVGTADGHVLGFGAPIPIPLTLTSTSGTYGTPLTLTAGGGSGTGAVSYAVTDAGSAGCSVTGGGTTLSATSAGTCTVTATKAADAKMNAVSSSSTPVPFATPPP